VTEPGQVALLLLQDLDTALDQHRHRRASLQPRAELAGLDVRLADVGRRRDEVMARRQAISGRQDALEHDLDTTETRRGEISRRLYGGTTSATRDLQAMAAEVESLTARASGLEDQVLAVMEELEPVDAELATLDRERAHLLGARIDSVTERRAEAEAAVPGELRSVYERLRTRLGGVGAARLVGASCTGCHLALPATELDRLRHEPPDALLFCDQCGRILVR
jgi:predicted  nucleic acid-binding Zn-ribbon protein